MSTRAVRRDRSRSWRATVSDRSSIARRAWARRSSRSSVRSVMAICPLADHTRRYEDAAETARRVACPGLGKSLEEARAIRQPGTTHGQAEESPAPQGADTQGVP